MSETNRATQKIKKIEKIFASKNDLSELTGDSVYLRFTLFRSREPYRCERDDFRRRSCSGGAKARSTSSCAHNNRHLISCFEWIGTVVDEANCPEMLWEECWGHYWVL